MRAPTRASIRALGALSLTVILSCSTPTAPRGSTAQASAAQATPRAPAAIAPAHAASADARVAGAGSSEARTVVQTTGTVTEIAPNTYLVTQPAPPTATPPTPTIDASQVRRSVRGTLQELDLPARDPPPAGGSFPDLGPALDARLAVLFRESLARELRVAVARAAPAGFTHLDGSTLRPLRHRCEREEERPSFLAQDVFQSLQCLRRVRTTAYDRSGDLVVREELWVQARVVGGEHRSLGEHTMATARETRDIVLQLAVRWRIDSALRLQEETVLLPHVLSVKPGPDHVQP